MQICTVCHHENTDNRYFCQKCGTFLKSAEWRDYFPVYAKSEAKVRRIAANLAQHPHETITWNAAVDTYAAKAERLRSLIHLDELNDETLTSVMKQLDHFIRDCRYPEFQIAFVGTIKTGKSTLINALLDHSYASTAVTPETASLTKFRSSKQDYVQIKFYTGKEWDMLWASASSAADTFKREYDELKADSVKELWLGHETIRKTGTELKNGCIEDELKQWSSSQCAEHYFVKEIEVGISSLKGIPQQVVFVDTPGLSDPVAYRSDITKNYIRRANAVFVCIDSQRIARQELDTISAVFSFIARKEIVYVIATHWDNLNDPVKDWNEQKEYFTDQLSGLGFFGSKQLAQKNIIHSSAFIYNLCRNFNGDRFSKALTVASAKLELESADQESLLVELKKLSNIQTIKNIIEKQLVPQHVMILQKSLEKEYMDIRYKLKVFAETRRSKQEELLAAMDSSGTELAEQLANAKKKEQIIRNNLGRLYSLLTQIDENTQKRKEHLFKDM